MHTIDLSCHPKFGIKSLTGSGNIAHEVGNMEKVTID